MINNLEQTAGVILAAGLSSRMGDFKPMMKIGSVSIIQRIIATLRLAGCNPIVVVTGFNEEELRRHLSKQKVVFLHNPEYETTQMFDSAKIAFRWLEGRCSDLFFTPTDIPLFTVDTLLLLLQSNADAAVPYCDGQTGHPLYLKVDILPALCAYNGEGGLKQAMEVLEISPVRIAVEDPGTLHDADTQEDYKELVKFHNEQLLRPENRITLVRETPFFGPGTAHLLSLIQQTESVATASQQIGISYSKCWQMIRSLEAEAGFAVLERQAGGIGGGSSQLTAKGEELLKRYGTLILRANESIQQLYQEEFEGFWNPSTIGEKEESPYEARPKKE